LDWNGNREKLLGKRKPRRSGVLKAMSGRHPLVGAHSQNIHGFIPVVGVESITAAEVGVLTFVLDILFTLQIERTAVGVADQDDGPAGLRRCQPGFHGFAAMRAVVIFELRDNARVFMNDHKISP